MCARATEDYEVPAVSFEAVGCEPENAGTPPAMSLYSEESRPGTVSSRLLARRLEAGTS
jgi:hypothetical protein